MKILGANLGYTIKGMPLNDGGACIIDENGIVAIAEERVTRKKYAGGFENALNYCLENKDYSTSALDLIVLSSCCELPRTDFEDINLNIDTSKIIICQSHHLSHAYSAYFTSDFEESLIMVLDNEGNIIDDGNIEPFYLNEHEKMTYYVGKGNKIELLERDHVSPEHIGIGDAYRYFTHYIGFPSYVYAGKTMGLAPYGNSEIFKNVKIFDFVNGCIKCNLRQNYFNPCEEIKRFFKEEHNIDLPSPRKPIDEITQIYKDLAYLIQSETERIIVEKVNYLVNKTGIKKLCIAGGVGLNSVVNSKILNETEIEDIHIIPASGDSGQCLGNALYGYHKILNKTDRFILKNAYLGNEYTTNQINVAIKTCVDENQNVLIEKKESFDEIAISIAKDLENGLIIGNFQGKSEFGPRALGHRSILMDPRKKENKDILNKKVKFRESFRPFAPAILEEYFDEYFNEKVKNPFMLVVSQIKKPDIIPAVTHIDNTGRVQSVSQSDSPYFYKIIDEFYRLTNVPVLLNTSFNVSGEPIVETPSDAINCFLSTNIDCLYIENYKLKKYNSIKMQ